MLAPLRLTRDLEASERAGGGLRTPGAPQMSSLVLSIPPSSLHWEPGLRCAKHVGKERMWELNVCSCSHVWAMHAGTSLLHACSTLQSRGAMCVPEVGRAVARGCGRSAMQAVTGAGNSFRMELVFL